METKRNDIFSLINTIPDRDTTDQCLYGSAYTHVQEKLFQIGQIEDLTQKDLDDIIQEMVSYSDLDQLILALGPDHYRKIDVNEDLRLVVLQKYLRKMAALDWCEARRQDVIMFGRIIGSAEKGKMLRRSGNMSEIWGRSVHFMANTPIEYRGQHRD